MYKLSFLVFFLFSILIAKSQAYLIFPETNITVKNISKNFSSKSIKSSTVLELPFFDDFSKNNVYPDQTKWIDNFAYINSNLAINPPSIGVATLDAINYNGEIYETANTSNFIADKLTSHPLNLDILAPLDTGIYLSFMYQAQGITDSPEFSDSLVLEFYSPSDSIWYYAWKATGTTNHEFKKVIIQIKDKKFLHSGFQFRFKNYASLSENSDYPGRRGNCDFWHIDWVYLNKYRNSNDTILNDLAFVKPHKSILQNYESVPWRHFFADTSIFKSKKILVDFKNNYLVNKDVRIIHEIIDIKSPEFSSFYDAGFTTGVKPNTIEQNEYLLNKNPFQINYEDSAIFTIKSFISDSSTVDALTSNFRFNDTIVYSQKFYNYYAYDDGSAEAGFGMDGNQTEGSKAALQFKAHKQDTLIAVEMYFNQTYKDASKSNFILKIWDDNNGKPGNVIYESEVISPQYEDSLNKFHKYKLDPPKCPIIFGKFYVGWEQIESEFINIGFDLNNDASSFFLYNIYGTWQQFPTAGSLMIRPIFGKKSLLNNISEITDENNITLYPNPTTNKINISNNSTFSISEITIFDISGKKVLSSNETENINVSNFSKGIYFVKIYNSNNRAIIKKLVIN